MSFNETAFRIADVKARWVLDSRGNPTVEVDVVTEGGGLGRAAAPAGASKGRHEALELRDGGAKFHGKGVEKAVFNVNNVIGPRLRGIDARKQRLVDTIMCRLDGTPNKLKLGANAIVATSLAVAKAAAATAGVPLYEYLGGASGSVVLPVPLLNIINGGAHAGNDLSFQEFMIVPVGADSFAEALRIAVEIYHELKSILIEKYGKSAVNVGDEGGYAPPMKNNREALDALVEATRRAGYEPGSDVVYGIDAAADHFYDDKRGVYVVDGKEVSGDELLEYYITLVNEYPIRSIEDPFYEEDFELFASLTKRIGSNVLIVGDDLYVTNVERLRRGIEAGATNAALLKVNQVGTLTEAVDYYRVAINHSMRVIVSHRSGETEDTTIAHIAVGLRTGFIKTGAPARGERTAKYNELLRIEEQAAGDAVYPGLDAYKGLRSVLGRLL